MLRPDLHVAFRKSRPRPDTLVAAGAPDYVVRYFASTGHTWGEAWSSATASPEVKFWGMLRDGFMADRSLMAVAGKACEIMQCEWDIDVDDTARLSGIFKVPFEPASSYGERAACLMANAAGIVEMAFQCCMQKNARRAAIQCCVLLLQVHLAGTTAAERERALELMIAAAVEAEAE